MFALQERKRNLFIALMLWCILIVFLSMQPSTVIHVFVPMDWLVNLAHVPVYGIMAFLLCLTLRFQRSLGRFRMTDRSILGIAFVLTIGWSALNEGLQTLSASRVASWLDLEWNILGAAGGSVFFILFRKVKFLR